MRYEKLTLDHVEYLNNELISATWQPGAWYGTRLLTSVKEISPYCYTYLPNLYSCQTYISNSAPVFRDYYLTGYSCKCSADHGLRIWFSVSEVWGDLSNIIQWAESNTFKRKIPHAEPIGVFRRITLAGQITLTHWGQDKMAAVSQTTLSNAFLEWKC